MPAACVVFAFFAFPVGVRRTAERAHRRLRRGSFCCNRLLGTFDCRSDIRRAHVHCARLFHVAAGRRGPDCRCVLLCPEGGAMRLLRGNAVETIPPHPARRAPFLRSPPAAHRRVRQHLEVFCAQCGGSPGFLDRAALPAEMHFFRSPRVVSSLRSPTRSGSPMPTTSSSPFSAPE